MKMMAIGRKRGTNASNSTTGSPALDSSTLTSPEGPRSSEASPPALAASAASAPTRELDACAACRASGPGRCKKRGSKGVSVGRHAENPPEVKVQQHGRGGTKEEGWRWMHMVQCLHFHEVMCGRVFAGCKRLG